ncbi:sensor histidine kinase [Nonomuraea sp. NPDC050556]|uniref:sensor histidine kinase n=1 Tax=Nonomuraea sp. NPDC050556 TaxID=3364369 RepID=UPI00379BC369
MKLTEALTFGGTADGSRDRKRRLLGMSVGLIYLAFPVLEIISGELTGAKAVWGAISLAAFVTSYIATTLSPLTLTQRGRWSYHLLALTTVMAIVFALVFGDAWMTLPVYTTVLYSFMLPPRGAFAGMLLMGATVVACGIVDHVDPGTIIIFLLQVFTLGVLFISVRSTRLLAHRLHEAQGEVARLAAGDERLRIARDLHDLLGHSLSLIVLKSELAGRLAEAEGSERVRAEVADIESVARQALVEVREAVTGYRQRNLSDELDNARAVLRAAGVEPVVTVSGTPLPDPIDGLLGWAAREGVTNVVRHAGATRCRISVTFDGSRATLEIVDNGRNGSPYEMGSGLQGLSERVQAACGTFEAGPRPGGFALRVLVPVGVEART